MKQGTMIVPVDISQHNEGESKTDQFPIHEGSGRTRKPKAGRHDAFRQQRMASWQPVMTPTKIILGFVISGIIFIPTGTSIYKTGNDVFEKSVVYDGSSSNYVQCSIDEANEGRMCSIQFKFDRDVKGPVLVYYQVQNFNQNHRLYVGSKSSGQLMGNNLGYSSVSTDCNPMVQNGSLLLNPCGLIANSFFNDQFRLQSSSVAGVTMDETGITRASDRNYIFKQVTGFQSASISNISQSCSSVNLPSNCKKWTDPSTNQAYAFYYPNDDTVQYLYETYPNQISPLKGVTDEHFIVWMKTAAMPTFRKLYGRISSDFSNGDQITFSVTANFQVRSYDGEKSLILTTDSEFGGKNPPIGLAFVIVGCINLFFGLVFALKHWIAPRPLGSAKLLKWE